MIIPFKVSPPSPNFAEFPDGHDACVIYCALIEARSCQDATDRESIEAILDRIVAVEQSQCIEWRSAFRAYLDGEPRP